MSQEVPIASRLQGVVHLHPGVQTRFDPRKGYVLTWTQPASARDTFWSRLLPARRTHKLVLDDLGRRTIELINSKRSVDDIARTLAQELDTHLPDMRQVLLTFLTQLMQRNIISVTQAL